MEMMENADEAPRFPHSHRACYYDQDKDQKRKNKRSGLAAGYQQPLSLRLRTNQPGDPNPQFLIVATPQF